MLVNTLDVGNWRATVDLVLIATGVDDGQFIVSLAIILIREGNQYVVAHFLDASV